MPTLGAHFSDTDAAIVLGAAKNSPEKKVGPYIAEAIRRRLEAEGHLPGTPAHDIRAEALAAVEIAGADAVLAALNDAKKGKYNLAA